MGNNIPLSTPLNHEDGKRRGCNSKARVSSKLEEWDIIIAHVHVYVSCPSTFGNESIEVRSEVRSVFGFVFVSVTEYLLYCG